mgnify:CR=1 FL=1
MAEYDMEEPKEGVKVEVKVVEADGLFVGFPSQKDKDGEYQDTISCDKTLRQQINKLAHDYYHSKEEIDSPTKTNPYENNFEATSNEQSL